MRRMRITASVALATAGVLCSLAAASASAEVPELGRCVKAEGVQQGKKTVYSGAYKGKNCTRLNPTGKGKYEFLPGPGVADHFRGIGEEPEPIIETVGGAQVECSEEIVEGEYTGPKTEKAKVSFGGCQTGTETVRECQTNPASEGVVEGTGTFEGELGVIKAGAKPTVGWDLKREGGGPDFVFECGVPPQTTLSVETIEGSVIGTLSRAFFGSDINKMSEYSALKYKASKGHQLPEMFEGAPQDVLSTKTVSGLTSTTEQTGLTTTVESRSGLGEPIEDPANQEKLEVKTYTLS
jgi:hypothetical protein